MSDRETFLARVRRAQPPAQARPELPRFALPPAMAGLDARTRFSAALEAMGGQCFELAPQQPLQDWIVARFGAEAVICSACDECAGTRAFDARTEPASLADVDVGVVRARLGVAETGSVWLGEAEYQVNALGYLAQHLVVLLDPATLCDGLQDVYRRGDFRQVRYAALVTGPSATADIEGVMIRGAQGVRSLSVIWRTAA